MALVVLLASGSVAVAQETTGDIRGLLRFSDGPVAEARVTATSPDLLGIRHAVSAHDGVFVLLTLPPGTYTLRVAAVGFRPVVIEGVAVQLGRTTGLGALRLEATTVELEAITVTAPQVTLDPVRTTIGATLEAADYDALPAERDYKSLIAILPHVNTSYHGDPGSHRAGPGDHRRGKRGRVHRGVRAPAGNVGAVAIRHSTFDICLWSNTKARLDQ